MKPVFSPENCLCSQCSCSEKAAPALLRCEDCHYFKHLAADLGTLHWYCAGAGHRDNKCSSREEHSAKLADRARGIEALLKVLDHSMEVGTDRRWGQMTFEEMSQ